MTKCRFRRALGTKKCTVGRAESKHSHRASVGAASSYAPHCLQQPIIRKVWRKYTLDISWLLKVLRSPSRSPQIWPHLPCLSSARCCVTRRLPSKQIRPGDAEAQIGNRISCCRNEGIRCVNFSSHSPCCRSRFRPEPSPSSATAQRNGGGAEGLFPRRAAVLPPGDRSGRFHHPGLPQGKSPQDQRGLRPGSEEQRAISRGQRPLTVARGHFRLYDARHGRG